MMPRGAGSVSYSASRPGGGEVPAFLRFDSFHANTERERLHREEQEREAAARRPPGVPAESQSLGDRPARPHYSAGWGDDRNPHQEAGVSGRTMIIYNGEHIDQDSKHHQLTAITLRQAVERLTALKPGESLVLNADEQERT